jgi:hypothetical protein
MGELNGVPGNLHLHFAALDFSISCSTGTAQHHPQALHSLVEVW